MMNLEQAVNYGKRIGVAWYVKNEHGCIIAGWKTKEEADACIRRKNREGGWGILHVERAAV